MQREFDPLKHCGAKAKQSKGVEYCRHYKGFRTNHPGTGRCWLHGGRSEGQKTQKGKNKLMQPRHLGLYSTRLTDGLKQNFEACADVGVEACNENLYYYVHARLLETITNKDLEPWGLADRKIFRMAKTLMAEGDEDITEEYVEQLRLRLRGLTESAIANVGNSLANMARSGAVVQELANLRKREALLLNMTLSILKTGSKSDREICLDTLRRCQVDSGLDVNKFNKILAMAVDEEDDEDATEELEQLPPGED